MQENMDLLGALVAVAFFVSAILVFIFRFLGKPRVGHWIGYFELLLAIPMLFLLLKAPHSIGTSCALLYPGCVYAGLADRAGVVGLHTKDRLPKNPLDGHWHRRFVFCRQRWNAGCGSPRRTCVEHFGDRPVFDHGCTYLCAAGCYGHVIGNGNLPTACLAQPVFFEQPFE
jgi:hypothetical protein